MVGAFGKLENDYWNFKSCWDTNAAKDNKCYVLELSMFYSRISFTSCGKETMF